MNPSVPSGTELRRAALKRIEGYVCKDRQATHGDAEDNFRQIAAYWALYKGTPFSPLDVAAMMALVKISRMATSPNHLDNWDDLAGYAVCGAGIVDKQNQAAGQETEVPVTKSFPPIPLGGFKCEKCQKVFGLKAGGRRIRAESGYKHFCLDCALTLA